MQPYLKQRRTNTDPFVQGFWFGVIFGTIGALVILGRQGRTPETTL